MRKLLFLIACLCVSVVPAFGQGVRVGDNPQVTTAPVAGGQLSAVANANISFCSHPANAVPCTNKATTYTDITLATSCPTSTQVVLAGTSTCVANSDGLGNWGVWAAPGVYDYTVQLPGGGSIGPYVVTLSGATSLLATTNLWTGSNTFLNGLFVGSPPLPVPGAKGPFTVADCINVTSVTPLVFGDSGGVCGGGGGGGAFGTLSTGTNTQAAMVVGTGASMAASGSGTIAATSAPFANLTGGTNNSSATMVVGTGSSISATGSGVVNANQVNGTTVPVNSAADQALLTSAGATGLWSSVPVCLDAAGQHLNYNTATHAFSCGTSGGTAGSAAFNTITNGTNASAAMVVGTGSSLAVSGSGTIAATSSPFSGVIGSTNTSAAMVLGTGSSLTISGSGTNNANLITGTTVPTNSSADQFLGTTASATGQWAAMPACLDAGGNHINYNTSTHAFSCGTSGGTAGSAAFNTITAGTNASAAMVVGTGSSLGTSGSGTITATALPFSGLTTASNTTATLTMGTGAVLTTSGSGQINANFITGTTVPSNGAADQVLGTTASATGSWLAVPSCLDTVGQHLNYNTSTHAFACGTTSSGGGGGTGTVVASPQFQLGSFPNSGTSATIQGVNISTDASGNNLIVPGDATIKGPNPYYDIRQQGARAVVINTTGTGSGTALAVGASTFVNGDGIAVAGGGAAPAIAAPTGVAVATGAAGGMTVPDAVMVAGMTNATTYNYKVFAVDVLGGATVPSSTVTTTTGPSALGQTQFTVSTWSLTGNTLTIVTSASSGLPVGTEVHITGTSNNALAGGWYPLATSVGATLTVINVPQYSATTVSGTGGTLTAFVGNSLTWTRSTGGTINTFNVPWKYYVCAQRPGDGSFHIIGSSLPSTFFAESNSGNFSNAFVDFGTVLSANPIIPWYLSDSNCSAGSAQNEVASTTVASGGGTTSLVLAGALANSVTGALVRQDNAPALLAAAAAVNSKGTLYIPNASGGFAVNSFVNFPFSINILQSGSLTVNDTVMVQGSTTWSGQMGIAPIPSFSFNGAPVVTCNAWPCVYVGGVANQATGGSTFDTLTFNTPTANGLDMLVDANWGMIWNKVNFQSGTGVNDNMGMGLVIRPGAADYTITNSNFIGGPAQVIDQTWTPLFFADRGHSGCCGGGLNVGTILMSNTAWNRRGFYYLAFGGDGIRFSSTGRSYSQGGITPRFTAQNTNGNVGGQVEINNVFHDTESQAAYAWICNIACSGGFGVPTHVGFVNPISQDAGTIPNQLTGGGNQPIDQTVAAIGAGGTNITTPFGVAPFGLGWLVQNGALVPTIPISFNNGTFPGNDIRPNVPTPELTLENGTFVDNITSLATSNRTKFTPDANGQFCVTGLVGCNFFVDTGAANAYVITPANPAIAALVDGMAFTVKPAHANTGASTLTVGSTAAASIKKNGVSTDPVANDILPKYPFEVKWDATDSVWLLTSLPGNGGGGGGSGTVNNSSAANNAAYYAGIGTTVSPIAAGSLSQFEQGVDSGAANVYVVTDTPPVTLSSTKYTRVYVSPTNSNTGNSTVNVDGNGAVPLVKVNSANLISGDFVSGALYEMRCLTTACFLMNPSSLTGIVPIALGGTGQSISSSAFNALAPATANGGLILGNGTNQYGNLGIGANGTTLTSNGTTASWTSPSTLSGTASSGQVATYAGASTLGGSANFTFSAASGMSLQQGANNTTMLYGARFTDTAPTGFFEQYQNAAKNTNIWTVDASGNVVAGGSITSGTSLAVHMVQIPEGTVTGCAAGFDAISANSTIHRLQICNNNGSFVNAVVSGADINTSDQVATTHLTGMSTGAIPKVSATGGLVTGALSDNATNVTSTEDLDFVANSHNNECVNDVSTGTTNGLLMKFTSTGCITITTSDTAIPVFIVKRGGATSGSNQFIDGGIGPCKMDTTVASNARGYYVIASASVTGDCTPQAAAPAVGTYIVGQVSDNSTASGATALVDTTSRGYYVSPSTGTGTITQIIFSSPLTGGTVTTTGTVGCASCVTSSSPGAGIAHFAGSTQAVTSSAVVGADMTNNTVTATQLAAQYSKWEACNGAGLGDGLNAIPAGTYLQFTCVNTTGVTVTLTGLSCWTDNAGSSTMAAANNAGTALLTGAVTCNSTKSGGGNAGTQSATTTLANNDAISFTFVADGTSKQTNWTVKGTY